MGREGEGKRERESKNLQKQKNAWLALTDRRMIDQSCIHSKRSPHTRIHTQSHTEHFNQKKNWIIVEAMIIFIIIL